ncbi:MAG TPA: dual specificity protein phosphatase [Methanomassiliicoccales archaeon]|nr:dual specificity protein phosphatase [Methanomassiliicoccales archaeon]
MEMEWIDETVAIGSWLDHRRHGMQRLQGIDLSMNARSLFDERFYFVGRRPNTAKIIRAAELLMELSNKGVKVMVHCYHGRDRSAFVVMVYLSRKLGIGYSEAFDIVRRGRPRARFHKDWVDAMGAEIEGKS